MTKCPHCNNELKQLTGVHKFAVNLDLGQENKSERAETLFNKQVQTGSLDNSQETKPTPSFTVTEKDEAHNFSTDKTPDTQAEGIISGKDPLNETSILPDSYLSQFYKTKEENLKGCEKEFKVRILNPMNMYAPFKNKKVICSAESKYGICERCQAKKEAYDLFEKVLNEVKEKLKEEINLCLKDCEKKKEQGMPPNMDWRAEALGYKTCLSIIETAFQKSNTLSDFTHELMNCDYEDKPEVKV